MRIHRLSYLCCLSLTAILVNSAWAQTSARRWALLVGVDDYIQAEKLRYCGADQVALRDRLVAAGFPAEQVILLHDKAEDRKYLPFKANIEKQLQLVLDVVEDNDLVIVGFSGHGVHLEGKSYFCPTDAALDKPESLVSLDAVYKQFEKSAAALKLLLVDACRNDPRLPGQRSTAKLSPKEESRAFTRSLEQVPRGAVLLNSCTAGEVSYEDKQFGHGVFMHYVLEGLAGAADADRNGRVSIQELSTYANQKTKTFVLRTFNDTQRPFLKGDLAVDVLEFELAKITGATPVTPSPLPVTITPGNAPKPGTREAVITNSIGMKLTYIPAGEFEMGSPESPEELMRRFPLVDREDVDDEQPVHKVIITRPFYFGVYEVTLGQFLNFYHDAGYRCDAETNGEGGKGINPKQGRTGLLWSYHANHFVPWSWNHSGQTDDHPAVNVSWNDATAFCRWLSTKEGKIYRLPTEAEWEFACRAGTASRFWFGSDPEELTQIDNISDASRRRDVVARNYATNIKQFEYASSSDGYMATSPVGRFRSNPWGLYDLHGNASEWCQDRYGKNYYHDSPTTDPQGATTGSERVMRGGSWVHGPSVGRSANRRFASPTKCSYLHGFRVVREL